jgi:hypothetical protein
MAAEATEAPLGAAERGESSSSWSVVVCRMGPVWGKAHPMKHVYRLVMIGALLTTLGTALPAESQASGGQPAMARAAGDPVGAIEQLVSPPAARPVEAARLTLMPQPVAPGLPGLLDPAPSTSSTKPDTSTTPKP